MSTVRMFDFATVVYVADGDTCDVILDLGFSVKLKQRFRLARINTPEVGQPGYQAAKDFLNAYVGKPVKLLVTKTDKYGRYLAEFIDPTTNVTLNTMLLDKNLAVPYAG